MLLASNMMQEDAGYDPLPSKLCQICLDLLDILYTILGILNPHWYQFPGKTVNCIMFMFSTAISGHNTLFEAT
jgi:hypothetical protein